MPDTPEDGAFRLRLALEADAVGPLLDALEAWAEEHEIPMTVAARLNLVAEEIAANVAMHAEGASFFEVSAWREGDAIALTVEDDGPEYDPLQRQDPDVEAGLDERDPGGLGVLLVRKLCATARYERVEGRLNRLACTLAVAA
jgi:serine/threonine-protein kinase RsbW